MVNLKTKYEKHANDNDKRCKSIKEKKKAKFNQSKVIQQALSNLNSNINSSKKIIFDDESNSIYAKDEGDIKKEAENNGKYVLFNGSESDNESFEIEEKTQFSGKKGFELLNLQSTYGNDERFKIDERFLENEADADDHTVVDEDRKKNIDDVEIQGEKSLQLKILENVLGTSVRTEKENKIKKRTYEMIRYDASNKDHEIYEKKIKNKLDNLTPSKKKKDSRKILRMDKEENKAKVSKEKFYEVSSEIRTSFKVKEDKGVQFSLLQTYGIQKEQKLNKEKVEEKKTDDEEFSESDREMKQKECEEISRKKPDEEKSVVAQGIWKESFFFAKNDARFKEGLDFINKKESKEATEAAENFDETRTKLKEILRLHLKKQLNKKDPFKNKIGGMNKKQLAGIKSKNPRALFKKIKTPKRNQNRMI